MNRTAKSQTDHDTLVKRVVNHLEQKGYGNICADLAGYPQPETIEGTKQDHIPDVTADGVIVEVETADSLDTDHTTSQFSLFADHAAKNGKEFWVVVPKGADGAANQRLNALGISAEVYTA